MSYEFVTTAQDFLTQGNIGGGTAMCMSRVKNDPMLVIVAQDAYQDIMHRRSRADLGRYMFGWVDAEIQTVIGMDTDGITPEEIYCIEGTRFGNNVHVIDSEKGSIQRQIELEDSIVGSSIGTYPDGFCMDDKYFYITFEDKIAVYKRSGHFVDIVPQPRGRINGMTRFMGGFLAVSAASGSILMLNEKLEVVTEIDIPASSPTSSPNLGLHAIAMDYYADMTKEPKVWLPNGTVELEPYVGAIQAGWHSDHNAGCDWLPAPARRFGRHKLHLADRATNSIFSGYLTDA